MLSLWAQPRSFAIFMESFTRKKEGFQLEASKAATSGDLKSVDQLYRVETSGLCLDQDWSTHQRARRTIAWTLLRPGLFKDIIDLLRNSPPLFRPADAIFERETVLKKTYFGNRNAFQIDTFNMLCWKKVLFLDYLYALTLQVNLLLLLLLFL